MRVHQNLDDAKAQHQRLLDALLGCDNPHSERAHELRGMIRELESDVRSLEQQRVLEMAARLKATEEA